MTIAALLRRSAKICKQTACFVGMFVLNRITCLFVVVAVVVVVVVVNG